LHNSSESPLLKKLAWLPVLLVLLLLVLVLLVVLLLLLVLLLVLLFVLLLLLPRQPSRWATAARLPIPTSRTVLTAASAGVPPTPH
jgi:hypothetical protein